MEFCDKLMELRKEKGYSQEQLAGYLNVSRQSVSKWEAGQAMPELGKLIQLSAMFQVTVDYLVKADIVSRDPVRTEGGEDRLEAEIRELSRFIKDDKKFEYKSKRTVFGIPLVHVCFRPLSYSLMQCSVGMGIAQRPLGVAKGIIAIGDVAIGVVGVGIFSCGILSVGIMSLGLAASLGIISVGILALGVVSIGVISIGVTAMGIYAGGVAAVGSKVASGISTAGNTALGASDAKGVYTLVGSQIQSKAHALQFILEHQPGIWKWLAKLLAAIAVS